MPGTFYHTLRDALVEAAIKVAPGPLARFNNARLGFPRCVYHGGGGIGDDLLCTCVFRELKKRGASNIVIRTWHGSLFQRNPDVDTIIRKKIPIVAPLMVHGLNLFQLTYPKPVGEHILAFLCRLAGITGEVALRPYIFLRPAETAAGRLFDRQFAIQSSCLAASHPSKNKEWYPERFQEVAGRLQGEGRLIQLGSPSDPPIQGALDLRGKTTLRQSAAILAQSFVFIGLEGFLMHLARAVDCRAVIVFGGRLRPAHFGYVAHRNLIGATPCSPCWLDNSCDYGRECMKIISVEAVVSAAIEQIERHGSPLEIETISL
jgi:ADP-heptose:LPS heptosyltransferase